MAPRLPYTQLQEARKTFLDIKIPQESQIVKGLIRDLPSDDFIKWFVLGPCMRDGDAKGLYGQRFLSLLPKLSELAD